jgi:acetyltransferase-like isoleucine patch superfamily enzyme
MIPSFLIQKRKNMGKYFVHKKSIVETKSIGDKTTIWAFVHILNNVKIGKNVNICDHCFIEDGVTIGDNVTIKSGVNIWKGIIIENNVFVGPSVTFSNDRYPRSKNKNFKLEKIILSEGCSVGTNSTILPGIIVGRYAMVGAGSVVTKNVPDYTMVYGNPAVIKGNICVCGNKMVLKNNVFNCVCKKRFNKINDHIQLIK